MKKGMSPLVTGITAGMIAGGCAMMMQNRSAAQHTMKTMKKGTGKALRTVSSLMDDMSYLMR